MFFLGLPFALESFPDGEFILNPSNTRKNEMLGSCHPLDTRLRLLQQQLTVFVQRRYWSYILGTEVSLLI